MHSEPMQTYEAQHLHRCSSCGTPMFRACSISGVKYVYIGTLVSHEVANDVRPDSETCTMYKCTWLPPFLGARLSPSIWMSAPPQPKLLPTPDTDNVEELALDEYHGCEGNPNSHVDS